MKLKRFFSEINLDIMSVYRKGDPSKIHKSLIGNKKRVSDYDEDESGHGRGAGPSSSQSDGCGCCSGSGHGSGSGSGYGHGSGHESGSGSGHDPRNTRDTYNPRDNAAFIRAQESRKYVSASGVCGTADLVHPAGSANEAFLRYQEKLLRNNKVGVCKVCGIHSNKISKDNLCVDHRGETVEKTELEEEQQKMIDYYNQQLKEKLKK